MLPFSRNRVNKLRHSSLLISYVLYLGSKDGMKLLWWEEDCKVRRKSIIVDKAFKTTKSAGIEKVILRTAESVAGFSEKLTSSFTGKKLYYKVHNPRFREKTVPCPVQVRYDQLQHDVDIQKCSIESKEKLYKYI